MNDVFYEEYNCRCLRGLVTHSSQETSAASRVSATRIFDSLTAFCTRVNRLQRRAGGVSALGALCSVRFIDGARLT